MMAEGAARGRSWEDISHAVRPRVPFTALNTVWRHIDKDTASVLDVGCGRGRPMAFLNRDRRFSAVGFDIFTPYLREARSLGVYDALVQGDVRALPFAPRSFDVVIMSEVLEHLGEEEGLTLVASLETIARKQVIITTPVGNHPQHEYDGNPWQEHQHIWEPHRLRTLGYRVFGHGLRNMGGLSGVQSPLPAPLKPLVDLLWVAAGPVIYHKPEWGGSMVGVKQLARSEANVG